MSKILRLSMAMRFTLARAAVVAFATNMGTGPTAGTTGRHGEKQ
jgi:hypothetical protein